MRWFNLLVLLLIISRSTSVSAQIFYEPVQYQYGHGAATFYYAGSNARMIEFAKGYVADQNYFSNKTSVKIPSTAIFSDRYPYRENQSMTINDVRNTAYSNLPRYFSKRDLLNAAVPMEDGSYTVPAQVPIQNQVDIRVIRRFFQPASEVAIPKGTILIIPKKLLEKRIQSKTVALQD